VQRIRREFSFPLHFTFFFLARTDRASIYFKVFVLWTFGRLELANGLFMESKASPPSTEMWEWPLQGQSPLRGVTNTPHNTFFLSFEGFLQLTQLPLR